MLKSTSGTTKIENWYKKVFDDETKKINDILTVLRNKAKISNMIKTFENENKKAVEYVNNLILKMNNFFAKELLEWKVNFNQIKNIDDDIETNFIQDGIVKNFNGSEGETKIIKMISLFLTVNENQVIVADDIFNSLDTSHIDEMITFLFSDKKDKNFFPTNKIIILTHNFEIFKSLDFIGNIKRDLYILDKDFDNGNNKCIF